MGCVYQQLNTLYTKFTQCYHGATPTVHSLPVAELPWLPGPAWGASFAFDLSKAIAYQANIQPDKTKPLMCTVTTTEELVS